MVRLHCWRHHMLGLQDTEKPFLNWLGNILSAVWLLYDPFMWSFQVRQNYGGRYELISSLGSGRRDCREAWKNFLVFLTLWVSYSIRKIGQRHSVSEQGLGKLLNWNKIRSYRASAGTLHFLISSHRAWGRLPTGSLASRFFFLGGRLRGAQLG